MPASSEFIALCRSQVALLTQGLGAALSVVYLTEELVEGAEAKLIPVVVYPETAVVWEEGRGRQMGLPYALLPEQLGAVEAMPRLLSAALLKVPQTPPDASNKPQINSNQSSWEENSLWRQRQIFLPLMHEGVVMGLLVTGREDRQWNEEERTQIERIAHTLAIACLIDQRRGWFEQRLSQYQRLQAQQRDLMDDLLHQFRNPLTAIRTFGKLLIRRLRPSDPNHQVASGIVRESDRLQELLQQLDGCIDLTQADSVPLTIEGVSSWEEQQTGNAPNQNRGEVTSSLLLPEASWARQALTLESCSVAEVLEPLLVSASAIAQERNLDLIAEIPSNLPLVQANAKALREVLSNLLDNALKYTPAPGQINIKVGRRRFDWALENAGEKAGAIQASQEAKIIESNEQPNNPQSQLAIAISDNGYGIPPQDLEHIFERHYRGVQTKAGIPGTGLGLAIAKELVEKMQGEVEIISPAQSSWAARGSLNALVSDTSRPGTTVVVWLLVEQQVS
ncbi:MAG: GAF domain-containing sensor histidine kinase [Aphanothece sp. CMT-3BRIN-NPC111]|nr:GAF domain-containing sensor histidine kinase [Aphanothece sp. CMT-3BRIN-NPC111]